MRLLLPPSRRQERGSVLMVTLLTAAVIGFTLASFLTMVRAQNMSVVRSQVWNSAIPIAEAGLEEALTHLNRDGIANLAANGWTLSNGRYTVTRTIGDGYYTATILPQANPIVECEGFASVPLNGVSGAVFASVTTAGYQAVTAPVQRFVSRKIRLNTKLDAMFAKAMVAKGQIDMKGNNVLTDSFDSANPAYSTSGLYDANKRKDNGDVATNSGVVNSLNVGNANIYGHAATGPGGSVAVGANGAVGDLAWQQAGNKGIKPGYSTDDMNVSFPDVIRPFSAALPPASGTVNGTPYTYVMGNGNFQIASIDNKATICVTGNATLLVTDSIRMTGNSSIIRIAPGGSLKLYVSAASASIGGNGVANETGNAANFMYYGMPSNTSLSFGGNAAFTGAIYAPNAEFCLGGGGNNPIDFIGSSVTKTVTMNGHFNFHYDENLSRVGPSRGYVVTSWDEI